MNMVKPRENSRNALKTLFVSPAVRYKLLIPQARLMRARLGFFRIFFMKHCRAGELPAEQE
ncbi:MAG TPA: hypothetical protein VEF76_04225 [Patescibacteria group bacterium]|nr:hypothetical protein [Patescibacteria group bacterium]